MKRASVLLVLLLGAAALALTLDAPLAQQAKKATVKAGKDEKVCRVRMKPSGEVRTWVCPKERALLRLARDQLRQVRHHLQRLLVRASGLTRKTTSPRPWAGAKPLTLRCRRVVRTCS